MKWLAAVAVAAPLLAQSGGGEVLRVTAVRHWALAGVTRIAIEVSGDFQYRWDHLHNPTERVYFDVFNSVPRIEGKRSYTEDVNDPLVTRIRVAQFEPTVARVVLDLAEDAQVSLSQLANPNRLIVEVRPASPASPQAVPTAPSPLPQTATPVPVAAAAVVAPKLAPEPAKALPELPLEVPKAARRPSSGQNSLIRALGLKISRVVIDPGHGGHDQGTEGPKGLLEKDLVLDVAQRVGKLVEEEMGAEVIYTRTDDTFVPLERRTQMANEAKADLFLSIHVNSSSSARVTGVETFYLNVTGSKDALDVAARENASSQKSVYELQDLIQKIARQDKAEESREFARSIQSALYTFSARNIPGSRNRGVKSAPFVVLIGASMPSVLAEIGFLSNTREESLFKKPEYRQKLAEALFRGLTKYADSLSHFQLAQTPASGSP